MTTALVVGGVPRGELVALASAERASSPTLKHLDKEA